MTRLWNFSLIVMVTIFLAGCATTGRKSLISNGDLLEQINLLKQRSETDSLAMVRIDALERQMRQSQQEQQKQIQRLSDRETNLETRIILLGDRVGKLEKGVTSAPVVETPAPPTLFQSGERQATASSYSAALQDYRAGKYRQAMDKFSQFIRLNPSSDLSDNAQYWIGECYYGLNNYRQALAEFQKVFLYPKTNKADAAQFKVGYCYLELGEKTRALAEFKKLVSQYPHSEYVEKAKKVMAQLQGD